jgi:UDP:flavonoid glycosyltransferase YjiC (YdhE family)
LTAKTILFAWELGRGLGHLMSMRRVAIALKAHGFHLVAAVPDPAAARLLHGVFDEMIAAPSWPRDAGAAALASSATLNDILAIAGLGDTQVVHRLLAAWDALFKHIRPDLVIADFAPAAGLAAFGRIPLARIGNGYTLPPHEMKRFPLLHRAAPPVCDETQTLAAVNAAMRKFGWPLLEHLPQIFRGDACLVQTFRLLDPYDTQRTGGVDGPLLDRIPAPRSAGAKMIFAYLSGGYALHPSIVEALMPFAARLRLHAPTLSAPQIDAFRQTGAQIDETAVPLADVLPSTALFVHRGGSGSAAEALIAGVPQFILSAQLEQDLTADALQQAGVARLIKTYEADAHVSYEDIETMAGAAMLAARAAALGAWHRDFLQTRNALTICETTCLRLLGV